MERLGVENGIRCFAMEWKNHNWLFLSCLIALQYPAGFTTAQVPAKADTLIPPLFFRTAFHHAEFLPENTPFFKSLDEEGDPFRFTHSFMAELGWQSHGKESWQAANNFPIYGIGLHYMRVQRRTELGHPIAFYGFVEGNLLRWSFLQMNTYASLGMATGMKYWDPKDPLPNDIFATPVNVFSEVGGGISLKLNKHLWVEPSVRLTHISNGNTREPQKGVNAFGYRLALRWAPGEEHFAKRNLISERDLSLRKNEVYGFLGITSRQVEFSASNDDLPPETYGWNFPMVNVFAAYNRVVNQRFKYGAGVDLFYDGTNGIKAAVLEGRMDKNAIPFVDKLGSSVFLTGENSINRLSIYMGLGYIVLRKQYYKSTPRLEQRLGVKYHLNDHLFVGLNVRAYHFSAAKALEFNVGYRFFLRNGK